MPAVIESGLVVRHQSRNGSEFFTLARAVQARYNDVVHYNGRRYVIERVEQVKENGTMVVRAAYRGKL